MTDGTSDGIGWDYPDVTVEDINAASANAQPGGLYGPPVACRPGCHQFPDDAEACSACGLDRTEAADLDRNP